MNETNTFKNIKRAGAALVGALTFSGISVVLPANERNMAEFKPANPINSVLVQPAEARKRRRACGKIKTRTEYSTDSNGRPRACVIRYCSISGDKIGRPECSIPGGGL